MPFGRIVTLLILLFATVAASAAEPLDPSKPYDAVNLTRKIQCSMKDGEQITFWWYGTAYSRRMGEKDKALFQVEGMNTRACVSDTHPERGKGFRLVSREILLYKDPKTGEVLNQWENPWTGETVDVLHVENDPVNFQSYEIGRNGQPASWDGHIHNGGFWARNTVPLYYPNVLASEYQKEIGGTYHATEMFNFFGPADKLLDPNVNTAEVRVGWSRMSDWLPWMNMGGREGIIYMHTAGTKLGSWDELSDTMKSEIRKYYPKYETPPPVDDDRRNVTSWSYFRDVREGKRELPDRYK
ncbi:MAG: DUF1838 family protein [Lysobacterales bacterium]